MAARRRAEIGLARRNCAARRFRARASHPGASYCATAGMTAAAATTAAAAAATVAAAGGAPAAIGVAARTRAPPRPRTRRSGACSTAGSSRRQRTGRRTSCVAARGAACGRAARPHTWSCPGRAARRARTGYSGLPPPPAGRGRGALLGALPGATERLPPGIDTSVGDRAARAATGTGQGERSGTLSSAAHTHEPLPAAARIPSRLSSLSQQHVQHGQGRADERARRRLRHGAQRRGRRLQRI